MANDNERDRILEAKKAKARREVERVTKFDDEIQRLMKILQDIPGRKLVSKDEILRLVYEEVKKMVEEDKEASSGPVKKDNEPKKDDRDEPRGGAPMAC